MAKIDFSGRGWLSGKKNTFSASLWKDGEGSESNCIYSAEGQWSETFTLKEGHGKRAKSLETFKPADIKLSRLVVKPLEEQDIFESRKAWNSVSKMIVKGDMDQTSHYKSRIENAQRALRRKEQEDKREWKRVFFSTVSSSEPGEDVFQKLVKMITASSVGSTAWEGVGADKTAGVWRYDATKAQQAKAPYHDEGALALGEKDDGSGGSADLSRVPTAEDVLTPTDGSKHGYPSPQASRTTTSGQ